MVICKTSGENVSQKLKRDCKNLKRLQFLFFETGKTKTEIRKKKVHTYIYIYVFHSYKLNKKMQSQRSQCATSYSNIYSKRKTKRVK